MSNMKPILPRQEDSEAGGKAIQGRAEAGAVLRPEVSPITDRPEAADEFLRNFLFEMSMIETLDCFQTEWSEAAQRGLVETERVGMVVPDVYIDNQRLHSELKNAQREEEEYRRAASAAAETLAMAQKARDFQRQQYNRVLQEKNRLIEEMRRLKVQCNSYEPAVKRMSDKYQAVLKQTALMTVERAKATTASRPSTTSTSVGMTVKKEPDRRAERQRDSPCDRSESC